MDENTAVKAFYEWYKTNVHVDIDIDDIEYSTYTQYGLPVIEYGSEEYLIGTDDDADDAVERSIEDTLYAFNADWIVSHLDTDFPVEAIKAIQEKYEDGNEALRQIIEKLGDWDHFVKDSVLADGRGHFLSGYDGEENEIHYEGEWYYIYRIN